LKFLQKKKKYLLNRYYVNNEFPRPESYVNDITDAETLPDNLKKKFYSEIATGAETGWDFSSRWFKLKNDFMSIHTREIIPVDLNSILYMNEKILRNFHLLNGNIYMFL
jgi:alpha,alpha-trehalase